MSYIEHTGAALMQRCPTASDLQQFLDSALAAQVQAELDMHISGCVACQQRLEELLRDKTVDDLVRAAHTAGPSEIRFPGAASERGPLGTFDTFHVIEQLGQGAFGVVYRAFDSATGRDVAIKVLKPEASFVESHRARFDREAKAAARVHHPNVVAIHHVGFLAGSGLPYLVFDYVPGETLEARLRRERVVSPECAAQFLSDVASGLAAIHTQSISGSDQEKAGLVHRDVKPSNIILHRRPDGSDAALLTDFGLARPLGVDQIRLSVSGQILGTVPYMSPEQIRSPAAVDGRADIYSLGVVGYEMLAGRRPYDAPTPADTIRLIEEASTDSPRRYNEFLPFDLETIILKCLAKEPARRYATAAALAADLNRFCRGEPIHARRVSRFERLRLWCRRKPALATALAALILVIVTAFPTVTWKWIEAEHERDSAERATREAEKANEAAQQAARDAQKEAAKYSFINRYLVRDLLGSSNPDVARGRDVTVKEVLARAARQLPLTLAGQPDTEAYVRLTIGETYEGLGLHNESEYHLRRALEMLTEQRTERDPDTLRAMDALAECLRVQHKLDEADRLSHKCLTLRAEIFGTDAPDTLVSMNNRAELLFDIGNFKEAEALCRTTLEARTRVLGPKNAATLTTKNNLAAMVATLGKLDEARQLRETLVSESRIVLGPNHPNTLVAINNLVVLLIELGRPAEAERTSRECVDRFAEVLGESHPQTINAVNNLAKALADQNKLDEAEPIIKKCLAAWRKVHGPNHPQTLVALNNLAELHRKRHQFAEAEVLYVEFLQIAEKHLQRDHPHIQIGKNNLAMTLQDQGRNADAEVLFRQVLETLNRVEGPNHPHVITTLCNLALVLRLQDKISEATSFARQSVHDARNVLPSDHVQIAVSLHELAACLLSSGEFEEAESVLREAISIRRRTDPPMPDELGESLLAMGGVLMENRKPDEAEAMLREAWDTYRQAFGPTDTRTIKAASKLGSCLAMLDRFADSESLLLEIYDTVKTAKNVQPDVVADAVQAIVLLYRRWDKPDRAAEWEARLKQ